MTEWEEIIPFKGRNYSGRVSQNFLYRRDNIFIMDNHRAALWCWIKCIDLEKPHSLMHIDRHSDALSSRLSEWRKHISGWNMNIEEYLEFHYNAGSENYQLFQWDNYLSIYLDFFGDNLKEFLFFTHDEGDKPSHSRVIYGKPWNLPENIPFWLSEPNNPWIVNIDLDYFYCNNKDNSIIQLFSGEYFDSIFESLAASYNSGSVKAITICLTPTDYTPGWLKTEELASRALSYFGLKLNLPR